MSIQSWHTPRDIHPQHVHLAESITSPHTTGQTEGFKYQQVCEQDIICDVATNQLISPETSDGWAAGPFPAGCFLGEVLLISRKLQLVPDRLCHPNCFSHTVNTLVTGICSHLNQ